jgi:signal transduction histidine kinase
VTIETLEFIAIYLLLRIMVYGLHYQFSLSLKVHVTDRMMRLQQIILNLARNAAKFVEKGFIRLYNEVDKLI